MSPTLYEEQSFAALEDGAMRPGGLSLTMKMLKEAKLAAGESILDIGCGLGYTVLALSRLGYQAQGIDISPDLIRRGKLQGANIALGDAYNLQGSYQALLYECSFSLLNPAHAGLLAARQVLQDGGKLLLSDLYLREGMAQSLPGFSCFQGLLPKAELCRQLQQAGFSLLFFADEIVAYKEFLATLIMEYGSMEQFWESFASNKGSEKVSLCTLRKLKLSYFCSVWQKMPLATTL